MNPKDTWHVCRSNVRYQIVLTKADTVAPADLARQATVIQQAVDLRSAQRHVSPLVRNVTLLSFSETTLATPHSASVKSLSGATCVTCSFVERCGLCCNSPVNFCGGQPRFEEGKLRHSRTRRILSVFAQVESLIGNLLLPRLNCASTLWQSRKEGHLFLRKAL